MINDDDVTLLGAFYNPSATTAAAAPLADLIDLLAESIAASGESQSVGLPDRCNLLGHTLADLDANVEPYLLRPRLR